MEIKEAMGYVQAVADNCNDAPRYQRALQTLLNYVEASYEEQNRLIAEISAQHQIEDSLRKDIAAWRKKYHQLEESKRLDDRVGCLLVM